MPVPVRIFKQKRHCQRQCVPVCFRVVLIKPEAVTRTRSAHVNLNFKLNDCQWGSSLSASSTNFGAFMAREAMSAPLSIASESLHLQNPPQAVSPTEEIEDHSQSTSRNRDVARALNLKLCATGSVCGDHDVNLNSTRHTGRQSDSE